jgi:hypothetical protein
MRLASTALALFVLAGCTVSAEPAPEPRDPAPPPAPAPPVDEPTTFAGPETGPVDESVFAEVVYVLMRDGARSLWFCTGTLVSSRTVVTAAHCLEPSMFVSYEVIAPLAPKHPRVRAEAPSSFGGHYDDVANPDIGILTLAEPIALPRYAELTDVVAEVEAGEETSAHAVVRVSEEPEAPLMPTHVMPVSSTVGYGYAHGFGTPMFSKGGDSGAGLFLVENGRRTHKLIGVGRQPEPQRDLDHFTRIDAPFLAWFAENASEGG